MHLHIKSSIEDGANARRSEPITSTHRLYCTILRFIVWVESEVYVFSSVMRPGNAKKKRIKFMRATSLMMAFVW